MAPTARAPTEEKNRKHSLKKPAVEKMRRDRINSGIEKLKLLLKDELNPKSKLEKADILETAVAYLKNHKSLLARASSEQCYAEGFARCLHESARFLMVHNKHVMVNSMGHAIPPNATGSVSEMIKDAKSNVNLECTEAVWRPWCTK
ncbi:transcription factor HES-5-like [Clarias magur]|uniref:Transcription factor HES-5-like n=1 Tax=Clarias magur TaxID=1594786 RepID=A0A8J4TPT6_CLAMG|nr:transcription factor HES-5-like [Clarias magur]